LRRADVMWKLMRDCAGRKEPDVEADNLKV